MQHKIIFFLAALCMSLSLSAVKMEIDGVVYKYDETSVLAGLAEDTVGSATLVASAQRNDVNTIGTTLGGFVKLTDVALALNEVTHYRIGSRQKQEKCIELLAGYYWRNSADLITKVALENAYFDLLLFNTYYNNVQCANPAAVTFTPKFVQSIEGLLSHARREAVKQRLGQAVKQGYCYDWCFDIDGVQGRDQFVFRATGGHVPWKQLGVMSGVMALLAIIALRNR